MISIWVYNQNEFILPYSFWLSELAKIHFDKEVYSFKLFLMNEELRMTAKIKNMRAFAIILSVVIVSGLGVTAPVVFAEPASKNSPVEATVSDAKAQLDNAYKAVGAVLKKGPADIALAEQALLKLPKGYGFIPSHEADQLLKAMGNHPGDDLQGLIVSLDDPHANWFMVVGYERSGYIKDDDAKDWKADDLLKSIKESTERANEERRSRGMTEMEVIGWVEKPQYDASVHRLVWSISSRDKGQASDTSDNSINYNTLALGREGFISMNLVTDLKSVESQKPMAKMLLSALMFNQGKRYADFEANTDKVAEYGLAALVAGVAAKKLGLFAMLAVFVAKFAKVIGIAAVVGLGTIKEKIFGRKKTDSTEQAPSVESPVSLAKVDADTAKPKEL